MEQRLIIISYGTESDVHDYQLRFNLQYILGAVVQPAGCLQVVNVVADYVDYLVTAKLQLPLCYSYS